MFRPFYSIVVLFAAVALLLTSCIAETKMAAQQEPYFSVKDFIEKEISRYANRQQLIYKEGRVNDRTELDTLQPADSMAWAAQFAQLIQADINKPALHGSYRIGSDTANGKKTTRYEARKEDLTVREFVVEEVESKVTKLFIRVSASNVIYDSDQRLTYIPDSLYVIEAHQKVVTGNSDNMEMRIRFK